MKIEITYLSKEVLPQNGQVRALLPRRFHLAWLTPVEAGYSRAIPLLWLLAFRQEHPPRSEVKTALLMLRWLRCGAFSGAHGCMRCWPLPAIGSGD